MKKVLSLSLSLILTVPAAYADRATNNRQSATSQSSADLTDAELTKISDYVSQLPDDASNLEDDLSKLNENSQNLVSDNDSELAKIKDPKTHEAAEPMSPFTGEKPSPSWVATQKEKARKFITSQRIRLKKSESLNFLNNGLTTTGKYEYLVEPAYDGSDYARSDLWLLEYGIDPLRIAKLIGRSSPVSLVRTKHMEYQNVRFYSNFSDALTANIVRPNKIPWTADRMLKYILPGDYAAFRARLTFSAGLSWVKAINKVFQTNFSHTAAAISGYFRINIYRLEGTKIRIKVFLVNSNGSETEARFGINDNYKIFIGNYSGRVTDIIENFLELDKIASVKPMIKDQSDLFTQVYDLDLANPTAVADVNALMSSIKKYTYSSSKMLNILGEKNEHEALKLYTISLDPLAVSATNPTKTGVTNAFRGKSTITTVANEHSHNLLVKKTNIRKSFTDNFVEVDTVKGFEEPTYENYLFSTWSQLENTTVAFGLRDRRKIMRSANAIYMTNSNKDILKFIDLGFSYDGHERSLTVQDQEEIRGHLKRVLPSLVYNTIQWNDFGSDDALQEQNASHIRYEYYVSEKGRGAAKRDILKTIKIKTGRDVTEENIEKDSKLADKVTDVIQQKMEARLWELRNQGHPDNLFGFQVRAIAEKIRDAFFGKGKPAVEAFHSLRENENFLKIGPALLLSLLPKTDEPLDELFYFILDGTAQGIKNDAVARFGVNDNQKLYDEIRCQTAVMNDDSFDLHLSCDKDRPKKRKSPMTSSQKS